MTQASDNEALVRAVQRWLGVNEDGWGGSGTMTVFLEKIGQAPRAAAPYVLVDPAAFFAKVKAAFGSLTQQQVDGFNAILTGLSGWPVSWIAYALATTWHETGRTMQPIKEIGGDAYFKRMYDIEGARPHKARELGNLTPGDGAKFPGMGFVQSTGRANARRATIELRKRGVIGPDVDLEATPQLLMRPDIAAAVMKLGMEEGWFTGKKLSHYLPGDYVGARRIINGTDKADDIAAYAVKFEAALIGAGQ